MASSLLKDRPKLGCWRTVCLIFYGQLEKRALLRNSSLVRWEDIDAAFLRRAMTGELFQTAKDWENLQRRLRDFGYSDDLTLLKKSILVKPAVAGAKNGDEPPTETAASTTGTSTTGTTTTTRNKRNEMDCHENDNHQVDQGTNISDLENVERLIEHYLRENPRKRLRDRILALRARRTNMRSGSNPNLDSQANVPLYREEAPAASTTAVMIPQDNVDESPRTGGSWLFAALTRDGSDLRATKRRKLASALRDFHATMSKSIHQDSFAGASFFHRKDSPAVDRPNRDETSRADVAPQQSGLATSTFTELTVNPSLGDAQSSAPSFVHPLSMDVTKVGDDKISSDLAKNQDVIGETTTSSNPMNNITRDDNDNQLLDSQELPMINTKSPNPPTDQQKVVGTAPMDKATDTTKTLPMEQKQSYEGKALLVTENSPWQSQDQQHESSSMTLGADDTSAIATSSAAVVPHFPTPYKGHVRDIMMSMAVWSISLHVLLWTMLGTDHRPRIHCLPGMKTDYPTRAHTNHNGPWLGQDHEGESASGMMMTTMAKNSSMYLQHVCSPWFGLMIIPLGLLLVSIWITSKLHKKIVKV